MRNVLFFIISMALFIYPSLSIAITGNMVAKVGDVPITSFELDRQISRIMPFNVSFHGETSDDKKAEIAEKALMDLILRAYKICYANSMKLKVPDGQVEDRINKIKERLKTQEAFNKAVSSESLAGLRDSIQRGLLSSMAEDLAVNSKVHITDAMVQSYFDKNKLLYIMPKQFRASHILIKVDPAATEDVRKDLYKKAEVLMAQARSGEDFHNLAYFNSDDRTGYVGGDLGMFHEGQIQKSAEVALNNIKVGEITDVVETELGYHVFKLTQVNESRQMNFEEVRPKIRAKLEKNQRDTLYEEWMNSLKKSYEVERFAS